MNRDRMPAARAAVLNQPARAAVLDQQDRSAVVARRTPAAALASLLALSLLSGLSLAACGKGEEQAGAPGAPGAPGGAPPPAQVTVETVVPRTVAVPYEFPGAPGGLARGRGAGAGLRHPAGAHLCRGPAGRPRRHPVRHRPGALPRRGAGGARRGGRAEGRPVARRARGRAPGAAPRGARRLAQGLRQRGLRRRGGARHPAGGPGPPRPGRARPLLHAGDGADRRRHQPRRALRGLAGLARARTACSPASRRWRRSGSASACRTRPCSACASRSPPAR